MRTKHICVLTHIRIKGEVGAVKHVKPSRDSLIKKFQDGSSFVVPLSYLCFTFVVIILSCLIFAAL